MAPGRTTLWRHHDFLKLWAGETVSHVGTMVGQLAVPLLAATALGATPWEMGLLTAASTAAFLLVGLHAGALLDRVRRRPVMIAADLVRFALFGSVPLAWWLGLLSFGQLLVVSLLAGVATVFFDVAYQSVLPSVVGREGLVEGNTKLESTRAAAAAAGPAMGGGLVQLVGAAGAVLLDAVSFLVSAAALARMRGREEVPERSGRSLRAEIGEGLRYVLGHRLLRAITACTGTANLFAATLMSVQVLYLAIELELPAAAVGLVLSAAGVAGAAGAVTAGWWIRRFGQGRVVVGALLVTGPFLLLVTTGSPVWFAVGLAAESYGAVLYNVAQVSFRQSICPDRLLGRMNASIRFLVWGTIPLGGLLGGALGELLGLRATLLVAAVGTMLAPLWLLLSPLRRLRDLPTADRAATPS
ncbi:MFS transporter [Pseudonocardia humida]|uniref:MFS transporter n=1 Tax=Pseudonocardia humida TaxID=2800819 RepID=A0ABT1A8Z7_9PSEU|nr:MFS transporter [Pseudonocardia humida]MCO1659507.1 MFS transporter [Pseudonocardia humida]